MSGQIYFCILILCGIFSQGNTGTFADEDIRESSNFLLRQKRVVNGMPGRDVPMPIDNVPYVVNIKHNPRSKCVGSILSLHVVITVPKCVEYPPSQYKVFSGTSRSDHGVLHNVTNINKHFGDLPSRPEDGIALLTVQPPFMYGLNTFHIPLHSGPLVPGSLGIVSGWGYDYRGMSRGTRYPFELRSIQVPILTHQDCVNRYRPIIAITDMDICTFHPQKHCGHTDGGAPLVVDGHLVGVHLWTGLIGDQNDARYPDVFAVLQHSGYNQWITTNVREIEAQLQGHRK